MTSDFTLRWGNANPKSPGLRLSYNADRRQSANSVAMDSELEDITRLIDNLSSSKEEKERESRSNEETEKKEKEEKRKQKKSTERKAKTSVPPSSSPAPAATATLASKPTAAGEKPQTSPPGSPELGKRRINLQELDELVSEALTYTRAGEPQLLATNSPQLRAQAEVEAAQLQREKLKQLEAAEAAELAAIIQSTSTRKERKASKKEEKEEKKKRGSRLSRRNNETSPRRERARTESAIREPSEPNSNSRNGAPTTAADVVISAPVLATITLPARTSSPPARTSSPPDEVVGARYVPGAHAVPTYIPQAPAPAPTAESGLFVVGFAAKARKGCVYVVNPPAPLRADGDRLGVVLSEALAALATPDPERQLTACLILRRLALQEGVADRLLAQRGLAWLVNAIGSPEKRVVTAALEAAGGLAQSGSFTHRLVTDGGLAAVLDIIIDGFTQPNHDEDLCLIAALSCLADLAADG